MSALVVCPHCSTRVLPMAERRCPACGRNVDAMPDPEPKPRQDLGDAYAAAAVQLRGGVDPAAIEKRLTDHGLDEESAKAVVGDLAQARARAYRGIGRLNMIYGAVWCLGGIAVTALTYRAAAGGGTYIITWGAIVFGGLQFLRGLIQSAGEEPAP